MRTSLKRGNARFYGTQRRIAPWLLLWQVYEARNKRKSQLLSEADCQESRIPTERERERERENEGKREGKKRRKNYFYQFLYYTFVRLIISNFYRHPDTC
jgi:hypothetical protein